MSVTNSYLIQLRFSFTRSYQALQNVFQKSFTYEVYNHFIRTLLWISRFRLNINQNQIKL